MSPTDPLSDVFGPVFSEIFSATHGDDTKQKKQKPVYKASPIKRKRRTKAEIEQLEQQIYEVLAEDHPQSVRHVFYRMTDPGCQYRSRNQNVDTFRCNSDAQSCAGLENFPMAGFPICLGAVISLTPTAMPATLLCRCKAYTGLTFGGMRNVAVKFGWKADQLQAYYFGTVMNWRLTCIPVAAFQA